jgi:hypothetical protein
MPGNGLTIYYNALITCSYVDARGYYQTFMKYGDGVTRVNGSREVGDETSTLYVHDTLFS